MNMPEAHSHVEMSSEIFPYNKRAFVVNLIFIMVFVVLSLFIFTQVALDVVSLSILLAIEALTLIILGVSPLITGHEIRDDVLILRQGWYFRAEIPLEQVAKVVKMERGPKRTGVFFRFRQSTIYVTTQSHDLLRLELKKKRRFGWVLGKMADKVVFDTTETASLMKRLRR